MTIAFMRYNMISRSTGKNAVASAAYRSGSRLRDRQSGKIKNYTRKEEVKYSEIDLPKGCTEKYRDRETLWNAVEQQSKRKDARLARELIIALPRELSLEDDIKVLQKYIKNEFTTDGMIADWSVHMKEDNPHCHLMLTVKPLGQDGETFIGQKTSTFKLDQNGNRIPRLDENGNQLTDKKGRKKWVRTNTVTKNWDSPENGEKWKRAWADLLEEETGIQIKFGVEEGYESERHEGQAARQIEEQGGHSDVCEYNRQVRRHNQAVRRKRELEKKEKELEEELNRQTQEPQDMKDVVADMMKNTEGTLKKYVIVDQLSKSREIPGLFDIMKRYKSQIENYVQTREKLQGRPKITQAISAIKYGAGQYRDELYDQLTSREKAQADEYQRKQEGQAEGQKRAQKTPQAPEPTKIKEQKQEFTAAPPKKKHGHGIRQTLHQIDRNLDNTQEKRKALQDYNETQRKIEQEQWRMQHRSDWDMD